jgi:hypothetical protein
MNHVPSRPRTTEPVQVAMSSNAGPPDGVIASQTTVQSARSGEVA